MLLLHQSGSVKIGEIVRYIIKYTPSEDRVQPPPAFLHLKIKNTSLIPLRAAYIHGPYTIYAAAYPAAFDPYTKFENPRRDGVPEFEPNIKASSAWSCKLHVPETARELARSEPSSPSSLSSPPTTPTGKGKSKPKSVTWIVEIVSQVIFSDSVSVGFELWLGRDEKSVGLSLLGSAEKTDPGTLEEHIARRKKLGGTRGHSKGVFSKAISLHVEDTESLWHKPAFPTEKDARRDVHLVIVTHGLHSNLGADMLYMKESIDKVAPKTGEVVIVRGFKGNAAKTEKGIQYLGKRLAKYVLASTFPDQPFLPTEKSLARSLTITLTGHDSKAESASAVHPHSSIHKRVSDDERPYKITSISFVGHSLGGLIQLYAIAYIQRHSPSFFEKIRPVNFVTLASPLLGLSNENPLYVKFALDFGLVGKTGQDLGLTWTPPTIARSGWGAMISGINAKDNKAQDPRAKPLLRVLPTGHAHAVLKKFQRRTVYANVVNDGIVPLRTSCLLFLDWKGLGKVEKARRENGLVGTMAVWGWGQLTDGPQSTRNDALMQAESSEESDANSQTRSGRGRTVPQPGDSAIEEDTTNDGLQSGLSRRNSIARESSPGRTGALNTLFSFFKPNSTSSAPTSRAPTANKLVDAVSADSESTRSTGRSTASEVSMGDSSLDSAPPRTSFFEAARDLLDPPMPPTNYIIEPDSREATIFHDRIYHSDDIPPPALKHQRNSIFSKNGTGLGTSGGSGAGSGSASDPLSNPETKSGEEKPGEMKLEEKIARAYHKEMTWRKVLVRLEPDAHNNIIVRRMFVNAHGWPVVKHLAEEHFGPDAYTSEKDADLEGSGTKSKTTIKITEPDEKPSHGDGSDDYHDMRSHGRSLSNATDASSVFWSDNDFPLTSEDESDVEPKPQIADTLTFSPKATEFDKNSINDLILASPPPYISPSSSEQTLHEAEYNITPTTSNTTIRPGYPPKQGNESSATIKEDSSQKRYEANLSSRSSITMSPRSSMTLSSSGHEQREKRPSVHESTSSATIKPVERPLARYGSGSSFLKDDASRVGLRKSWEGPYKISSMQQAHASPGILDSSKEEAHHDDHEEQHKEDEEMMKKS